jgi:hypothetical protein
MILINFKETRRILKFATRGHFANCLKGAYYTQLYTFIYFIIKPVPCLYNAFKNLKKFG